MRINHEKCLALNGLSKQFEPMKGKKVKLIKLIYYLLSSQTKLWKQKVLQNVILKGFFWFTFLFLLIFFLLLLLAMVRRQQGCNVKLCFICSSFVFCENFVSSRCSQFLVANFSFLNLPAGQQVYFCQNQSDFSLNLSVLVSHLFILFSFLWLVFIHHHLLPYSFSSFTEID